MDALNDKLQRLNTNESTSGYSVFSRNASCSSVSTVMTPSLPKSLSFTKISDQNLPKLNRSSLSSSQTSISDALHLALSKIPSNQPKFFNKLTTTPINEPIIESKWCIILVGLPAVGKSSICKNLKVDTSKYFGDDVNFRIDSFNAGHFRRKLSDFKNQTSNYFDFNNQEAKDQREMFARIALDHLLNSLINSQIDVGIFDATNSTKQRRDYIIKTIKEKEEISGVKINTLILHVKCTDESFWKYNVEGKTTGPDYIDKKHDNAIQDFIKRANLYREAFEDIDEDELKEHEGLVYMEINNAGKSFKIESNGYQYTDDAIYIEFKKFIENYYEKYGKFYEDKVNEFKKFSEKV